MVTKKMRGFLLYHLVIIAVVSGIFSQPALAASEFVLSHGQTIYVPVYSNVVAAPKKVPVHLANMLTIRNTDINNAIQVINADYYDTKGALIRSFYKEPVVLAPLETTYVYLSERDQEGGPGANFIIRWHAAKEVNAPIVECLMVGSQGRAFISPGHVIKENTK